jgi:hypothetical protein
MNCAWLHHLKLVATHLKNENVCTNENLGRIKLSMKV